MRKNQSGVMLLEALIAILIFSMGILGLVGMQASAIKVSRDSNYRSDATLLANEVIAQMWSGDRTGSVLQANFQGDGALGGSNLVTDGAMYTTWAARVTNTLPGAAEFPPVINVTPGVVGPPTTASQVTVTVRWQAPTEAAPHAYRVVVQII